MQIGGRIGLGFAVILLMFIITSFFSLNASNQSQTLFANYAETSADAIAIMAIDHQVSELQRVLLVYSNTGHSGIIARAKKDHKELVSDLATIEYSIHDHQRLKLLQSMLKILGSFGQNIDILVESRITRDRLLDKGMGSLIDETTDILTAIQNEAGENNNRFVLNTTHSIHEQLLKTQINAISFFGNKKYSLKKTVKDTLVLIKNNAAEISGSVSDSRRLSALAANLEENIIAYEERFYQAVQATRDYTFLVNVVMAGQANEFSTLSHALKTSTLSILENLTETTTTKTNKDRKITLLVTIGAISIGIILAILLSRSLSLPVRKIARAFEKLVKGEKNINVPGLNRGDEIGQLAIAANVFKEMNENTKKILEESQLLAGELQLRESQLEQQTTLLQKSNDELDNFAYIASHDLKSPLRAIDSLCKWVTEDCIDILPKESSEHLSKMQQRILRMENLLTDLLNYSRVGRVEIPIETVNVRKLIQAIEELIDKPETFIINTSNDLPEIKTQAGPLQQVFLNLFTNAIKYNDKENGVIEVSSQWLNDNVVEFSVSDNGPGIDPKFHTRIFQMFQTLQPRDVIESSGMGLAIIKKVIEGQGGEIQVKSELGRGSEFVFSWVVVT